MRLLQISRSLLVAAVVLPVSDLLAAFAQQEPAFPAVPTRVVVSVEPRHGQQPPTVRAEDVTVIEGKERNKVLAWQKTATPEVGVEIFLFIDDALSVSEIGTKLNDIREFINAQSGNIRVGVAYMRDGTALIAQNPTNNHAQAVKALRVTTVDAGASASPYFALEDLLKRWPKTDGARQVVMITDGIDRYWDGEGGPDNPYLNSAIHEAQRNGIVVNALYARGEGHFGHSPWQINWGQSYLSELADATGGEAYYLANTTVPSFRPYFTDLTERISHQFLLTFAAQPGKKSGFERIGLSTEVPNAELVTQRQVYVSTGS